MKYVTAMINRTTIKNETISITNSPLIFLIFSSILFDTVLLVFIVKVLALALLVQVLGILHTNILI